MQTIDKQLRFRQRTLRIHPVRMGAMHPATTDAQVNAARPLRHLKTQ